MAKKITHKELVNFLRDRFAHKNELANLIEKKLNIKIPKTYSYEKILSIITEKNKENDFSKLYFNSNSFSEILEKRNIQDALYIFSKKELELIAKSLSQNKKLWNYDITSLDKLRNTIIEKSSLSNFSTVFPKLILEKKIYSIMQYYHAVIGPLGITRSKVNRKSMEAEELVSFLSNYITPDTFQIFLEHTNFQKILSKINIDKNLHLFALHQYILTNYDLKEIRKIFDKLLDQNLIHISTMERFWTFTVTPCGIILNGSEDPIENLIQILVKNIPKETLLEELEREGYQSGTLELRLYAKCVWSKPEDILSNEFGKTTIREICKELGLVGVNKISDLSELIKYLLLKIGFTLPEHVTGISEYISSLQSLKNSLQYRPKSDYLAIMPKVYQMTERILKDMIYFYSAIRWESILDSEDRMDIFENMNKKIKEEFQIEREVPRLSFGALIGLMKKMDSSIEHDKTIKKAIQKKLHRTQLFPSKEISLLAKINDNRAKFTHDVTGEIPRINLSPEYILDELLNIAKKLQEKTIYPLAFRTIKEVTTEYGISYYEVIDEFNNLIALFSTNGLETGKMGFMISNTDKVAVKPTIVEKYWT